MYGRLDSLGNSIYAARASYPNLVGVGITPEAIDQAFPAFDILLETGWRAAPVGDAGPWLQGFAARRYGASGAAAGFVSAAYAVLRNATFKAGGPDLSVYEKLPKLGAAMTRGTNASGVLEAARQVVIIPGYGMAVSQAQHQVRELADLLEQNGAEVRFAIHPVAGRMPGHMNVLLAEASVPYEQLVEMDAINPMMPTMDVAIVIGANDVVNPAAARDKSSPIYGMPIINAHEARTVICLKRGKGTGFSGIENQLFLLPNTRMLYGDAKAALQGVVGEFKSIAAA